VVARGSTIELLRPDENTGKLVSIASSNTFSVIRSLKSLRLHGTAKDYIVVGSDSGKLVILEFEPVQQMSSGSIGGTFKQVKSETYGKTGCRRAIPGQYLAADPQGRAIMVGAVDKQKLVYIMNRDASNRLTISSPLEAHKVTINSFEYGVSPFFLFSCW
jgi:splicing factor 3B subunit 3